MENELCHSERSEESRSSKRASDSSAYRPQNDNHHSQLYTHNYLIRISSFVISLLHLGFLRLQRPRMNPAFPAAFTRADPPAGTFIPGRRYMRTRTAA